MSTYHNRAHVKDLRAMKKAGKKLSMLFVTTLGEATAASSARIDMLSIETLHLSWSVFRTSG